MSMFDTFFRERNTDKNRNKNLDAYKEEFSVEWHDEVSDINRTIPQNKYFENGVHTLVVNDTIRITYNGLLAKNGASDVYAVVGYGDNTHWDDVKHYHMQRIGSQTFELLLPVNESRDINIAFKDSANHWDNNSGKNYVFNPVYERGNH